MVEAVDEVEAVEADAEAVDLYYLTNAPGVGIPVPGALQLLSIPGLVIVLYDQGSCPFKGLQDGLH